MKKSLIALAALAATASFAQSSVTISGTFDPSVQNVKTTYGNDSSVSQNRIGNNGQGTSQITFKGVEDLGGGLKASFLFENDFDAGKDAVNGYNGVAGATNFGSKGGEQYLALEGGFGKIAAGAPNTPTLTAQSAGNPFSTKVGSGFGVLNASHVRNSNSLVYSSPVFSGFDVRVGYGFQTKVDTGATQGQVSSGAATDIGAFYNNGPVSAGVSFYQLAAQPAAGTATGKNKEVNAYVTYDFGVAKIGAGYYTEKTDNATAGGLATVDSKAYNLSAAVPLNANLSLLANYGKKDDKVTANNNDVKIAAFGLKYNLSKRSSLYARYVDQKTDNVTSAATAKKVQTALVGMQHNF